MSIDEYLLPPYYRLHGSHEVVALPSPAAGAALTSTVPGAVEWTPYSISFLYTASGNAATRIPFVQYLDWAGTPFLEVASPFTLVATNVAQVTFAVDIAQFGANSAVRIGAPIPPIRLGDGLRIKISATAIDAADTITAVRLFVRQFDVVLDTD